MPIMTIQIAQWECRHAGPMVSGLAGGPDAERARDREEQEAVRGGL